jgi:putative ABC transport system substrate-binding protein
MKTLFVILAVTLSFFSLLQPSGAQQPKKLPVIGYVSASVRSNHAPSFEAFRQGLGDLGYIEGENIVIEARYAEGKAAKLPEILAELMRLKVDVLVLGGSEAARPAREIVKTIPIIVAHFEDPVGEGFVTNLARPGGNMTGLSRMSNDLAGKRLEILKEAAGSIKRVGLLLNPRNPATLLHAKEAEEAAPNLGLQIQRLEVRRADEIEPVLAGGLKNRIDALIPSVDRLFDSSRNQVLGFAIKNRLPTMYHTGRIVEQGGLMSYATNVQDLFRRSATYVDKILKGIKPGDLPIEQPTKFELVINLKTAKQIGLTIPPNVLARADRVIK